MGLFDRVFGKHEDNEQTLTKTNFEFMGGYDAYFSTFGDNIYNSDTVRSCIHTIANNTAKLKAIHMRSGVVVNDKLATLLSVKPNMYMDAFSFYYKVVTNLYTKNNAFIYIDRDFMGNVLGLYPINYSSIEMLENKQGEMFARFTFMGGQRVTIPYQEIVHLRRFYNENDLYGETNSKALLPTLELDSTTSQGIIHAIKSSANLRGILKFTQSLREEDIKKQTDNFTKNYMSINNNGGIAGLDSKADYINLKTDNKIIDSAQMEFIEKKIYKYFNVNENIVMSKYSEEEWDAFYESVIEPIAIQLSLQFTSKLFTDKEQGFGNQIVFEANRLQYVSVKTKIQLIKELGQLALLSVDESREILNMSPIGGEMGETRYQTLNVADTTIAKEYQIYSSKTNKVKQKEVVDSE